MRKQIKIFSTALIFLICLISSPVSPLHALDVPALTGRVNDYAGLLSAGTKSILESQLAELEKSDSTQIAVLTIPSLQGDALEDFSIRVADKWKIGHEKLDNGAILIIAKEDRAVRIEVGYGLEGSMTDLVSGRIIDNIIIPNFRNGDYDTGVLKGVDAIVSVVRGEFTAKDIQSGSGTRSGKSSGNSLFVIVFLIFMIGALGSVKRIFGGLLGAAIFPIAGLFLLPLGIWILLLIPIGFVAGLLIPFIFALSGFGRGGGSHGGGGFGGFSGGGFGGGGGFSGGGGGFGGGGASGRW